MLSRRRGNSDQGNFILDCTFGPILEPAAVATALERRTGIVNHGLFLKGHAGGESGTTGKFSFRSQVGFLIENGEISDIISSVTLNGNILEYLKKIDAVGRDFSLEVDCGFGGCGKGGQRALVGLGGPYIRFRDISVTSLAKPKMPMMGMMK